MQNTSLQTIHIGYWKTTLSGCQYPMPEANTARQDEITEALMLLKKIKESVKTNTLYTKGVSPCRLCNKSNGSIEYVVTKYSKAGNPMMRWCIPEGYEHYLVDHKVKPDLENLRTAAMHC